MPTVVQLVPRCWYQGAPQSSLGDGRVKLSLQCDHQIVNKLLGVALRHVPRYSWLPLCSLTLFQSRSLTIAYRMGSNKTAIGVFWVSELILLGGDRIDKQINKHEVRE